MRQRPSTMPEEKCQAAIADLAETYRIHFAYLETGDKLSVRGIETQGLNLPESVLQKLYRANAERWYAGLASI